MKKLLALTLSLLMVFSVVPMTMASAEGETYLSVFDASSETASSQIGSIQSSDKNNVKIATYAVPTGETDADGNPVTEDRTVLKFQRTGAYNGAGVGIKADYRSVIKGAIGIRFWMAGDPTLFNTNDKVSLGFQTSSMGYKTATEHRGNWLPTAEGATYEWYWNTATDVWKIGATSIDSAYNVAGKANALFTDSFLGQVKQIMFGVDAYSAESLKEVYYIDDVELIYPAGVTPAPIEFVASFVGTETATLAADVEDIKSDAANNDAVVMPEAILAEGELEGWAFNGDITKVYAPGETANITNNTTFYAVRKDRPALATPAAPVAQLVNGASVTLTKVDGAVYSKDGATWQTSNVFTGLTPGASYTFYQKMAETLTHAESAVSEGVTVTTPLEYVYEAEKCSPIGYKADDTSYNTGSYATTDGGVSYTYVQDNTSKTLGYKDVFTVANLPAGIFTLTTYSRNVANSRSSYEVTILNADGEVVGNFGTVNFADLTYKFDGATYHSANYLENEVTIEEEGTYTLVFTNVKAGQTGICLDSFAFKKVADYNATEAIVKIDGEEVAVLDIGATYTIPTPPTGYYYSDGNNDYYGGEQVVLERNLSLLSEVLTAKEVYTMDEGKALTGATTFYGSGSVMDVDGDNKLALKAKSDAFAYFQLPANWSSKPYYKPTKITFTASASDTSKVKAYKSLSFASALADDYSASGSSYTIAAEGNLKYFTTTVSINVTEDMYSYKYITGKLYSDNWSESNASYVYIDNVTIDYEYDFDYVPPTECKVTVDGVEVATVLSGTTYTLPQLEAGKYYVGYEDVSEVVITGDLNLTTATYTFDITVDGQVVATVDYGTEYTLPALEAGKYYVDVTETTFVVTENKEFTTATYKYDITIDGNVVATVEHGTEYTLPTLPVSKYYVGVTEKTFTVTSDLTFTTANKDAVDSLIVHDVDANGRTNTIGMWGTPAPSATFADRQALRFSRGNSMTCGGVGVSDVNMFGSFADYADTAIGVRFWAAANSDEVTNNIRVYIGAPKNVSDNYTQETLAGETVTVPGTTWTQYTVLFNDNITPEDIASMTHILFTTLENGVTHYVDDVELLVAEDVDASCDITIDGTVVDTVEYNTVYTLPTLETGKYYVGDPATTFTVTGDAEFTTAFYTHTITIDGEVVATVDYGTEYTLPALDAGKYYVGEPETTFVVTEDKEFTTATYTYTITIDGQVVDTVDYGTEYTLPALDAGKYYVGNPETTFVVTENKEFTTAVYTFDITIDGVKVATVAYGDTFVLPAAPDGKQYVDGYVDGQEFVVTEALNFTTEEIPEQDGATTNYISTQAGASIRLNEANGMRFYATVDAGLDLTTVDEMGIIIAPNDIVGDYFTMEDDHIKVVYDHKTHELWDGNQIVGSIVNVADRNLGRDFIARAYVVINGVTYYAETATVRNLAGIADAYIADANGGYATLDADTKALVDTWAKAND